MAHNVDFFRDEIRNGFYIPTAIKQSWASALDVLSEIDRICKKHDINYFADWGTFLGAVRHGGIIPWDDDIDIAMLRDDYDKFRAVADSELPEGYAIHDYERQENYRLFLTRIVGSTHICFDPDYLNSHYNFPWIASVDIFVKDYLYKDSSEEKTRCDEIMLILAVADGIMDGTLRDDAISEKLQYLEKKYDIGLPLASTKRELFIALYRLAEKQMARCPKEGSDRIGQIFPWGLKGNPGEPASRYESFVQIPFESTTIPVPSYYNAALSARYSNYNNISKNWDGHAYPAFDMQKKLFEADHNIKLPTFTFDSAMTTRPAADKSSSLKSLAHECLCELNTLYESSVTALSDGDTKELERLLNSMQQLAADLGTMTENVKGEDSPRAKAIVKWLEELCEVIFKCFQSAAESAQASNILAPIKDHLSALHDVLDNNLFNVKEILFLPVGPVEWRGFEQTYNQFINDRQYDVTVIPLPLLTKNCTGQITSTQEEIAAATRIFEYPSMLKLTSWADYDLSLHCPDAIYIQNTYDGENPCITIPPYYYASNLTNFTDNLIYIPIGKTSEFTAKDIPDQMSLGFYITKPGAVYADEILVQSENIKAQYVNALARWAGNATLTYWDRKIHVKENLYAPANNRLTEAPIQKELLFCVSLYEYTEHKDDFSNALTSRLTIMSKNKDTLHTFVCLYPDYSIDDPDIPGEYQEFHALTAELSDNAGIDVISFPEKDLEGFSKRFAAYYGSSSPLVPVFSAEGKPVMVADYNIRL
ncbi:LicD family protein [Butyrivibrio sp. FCS014]|uniref:LicD family protein n=1 Tax=Butyrivibrio sp. FCS014 TaxID=1408304 RepID=UPI000463F09C|nr:LicD family protein [Butyrivibrio sp. FCS014]